MPAKLGSVIAVVGLSFSVLAADSRLMASEPRVPTIHVTASDLNSPFIALAPNKAVVIELGGDIADAFVTNPKIVNAIVRTKRRVYIMGAGLGQTNVFFFDAEGRQIGGLNIAVANGTPPVNPIPVPAKVVFVTRGVNRSALHCTPAICVEPAEALPELPPGYTNISDNKLPFIAH